ncbi:MAG TPA: PmoA family protein, partial [Bacteroidales bacterium]|nr:PmoA family protein [Bacteroidales bacterium]
PDGGHPHHRGIFWAWPEVEYGKERGDIYALQRVFARPTGNIKLKGGQVFAEIDAENLWMWEDTEPIVKENAIIRVYHSTTTSRIIDLTIKLLALKDSVTIATRFTNSYGGLNIRMQTPENQNISFFTDRKGSDPLRAWSDFNGIFEGNKSTSGLMVLQHKDNPEYPGEWKEYPELAWVQPTFPTPNTRYLLSKEVPLILRYRLIIHSGGKQNEDYYMKNWDAYHSILTPFKID